LTATECLPYARRPMTNLIVAAASFDARSWWRGCSAAARWRD
jgi:hypothetical protein